MAIDYTATEVGGFGGAFTQLSITSDGTTSTTDNFAFAKVTGSSTQLVISKNGTALTTTIGGDGTNALDLSAYEYTLNGKTFLAVFFVEGAALRYAVYNDQLEVVEAEATLTSTYTTIDGIQGIYNLTGSPGVFLVDASSTSGSSGNFYLSWQDVNSAPTFFSDLTGEADAGRAASFVATDLGVDADGDAITLSAAVASGNAISFSDSLGKFHVIYTGPVLAEGATANVTINVGLSDGTASAQDTYEITFEGNGSSNLTLSLDEARALIDSGYDMLSDLGGIISGVTLNDSAANIAGLGAEDLQALASLGVKKVDLSDNQMTLDIAHANAFMAAGVSFAHDDSIKLIDSSAELRTLSKSDISELADLGVTSVETTNETLRLNRSAYDVFTKFGIEFSDEDSLRIVMTRGAGDNDLTGTKHADRIFAGGGDDVIRGKAGNDVLHGGTGDDRLTGGAGADIFVFEKNSGHDTITDFRFGSSNHDQIDLSVLKQFEDFGDVTARLRQHGDDVILKIDGKDDITIRHAEVGDFTSEHFIF